MNNIMFHYGKKKPGTIKTKSRMSDNIKYIVSTILPVLLAVAGWYFVNFLNAVRDRDNKFRDIKIQTLITVYNNLLDGIGIWQEVVNTYEQDVERHQKADILLNKAFRDIQLVGSNEEIDLTHNIMVMMQNGQNFDMDPLIDLIRNDLRTMINIEHANSSVRTIFFEKWVDSVYRDSNGNTFRRRILIR